MSKSWSDIEFGYSVSCDVDSYTGESLEEMIPVDSTDRLNFANGFNKELVSIQDSIITEAAAHFLTNRVYLKDDEPRYFFKFSETQDVLGKMIDRGASIEDIDKVKCLERKDEFGRKYWELTRLEEVVA